MASTPSAVERIGRARYALLTTFRKDGTPVATPVWVVRDGDAVAVWTSTDSGKVKRIRRDDRVTVAPSSMRGSPRGPAVAGRAELLDAAGTQRVRELVKRKYRILGPLTVGASTRRRGTDATVGVRIMLDG